MFLGKLVGAFYKLRPELLDCNNRQYTLSQLLEFGSVENARQYAIEKEVETLLRSSHSDQFDWLEHRFDVPLREGLSSWPFFVELTERRNLFVHTGGIVSTQYLQNCRKHKVAVAEDCKLGIKLDVSPDYFRSAYEYVFEIGVKLAQVLWRKLFPSELENADQSLNNIIYDLLVADQLSLAIALGEFGNHVLKTHGSDEIRRMLLINWAQAYKWHGADSECKKVLSEMDWTACNDVFNMALLVLHDNYGKAASIMKRIGKQGDIREDDYKIWPLFREFRQTNQFLDAFNEIFGHQFTETTVSVTGKGPAITSPSEDEDIPFASETQ